MLVACISSHLIAGICVVWSYEGAGNRVGDLISHRTSYRKISPNLQGARMGAKIQNVRIALQFGGRVSRDACQISVQLEKLRSRIFVIHILPNSSCPDATTQPCYRSRLSMSVWYKLTLKRSAAANTMFWRWLTVQRMTMRMRMRMLSFFVVLIQTWGALSSQNVLFWRYSSTAITALVVWDSSWAISWNSLVLGTMHCVQALLGSYQTESWTQLVVAVAAAAAGAVVVVEEEEEEVVGTAQQEPRLFLWTLAPYPTTALPATPTGASMRVGARYVHWNQGVVMMPTLPSLVV